MRRVRLFSVGPAGARYSDVTLDLRDAGALVQVPVQEALFGVESASPPRRPAPATVLFLENGGGKSVLIKLIFSVLLPGRRQVVGTTNTRVLENFVGAGDVAHVLLEWQHSETGARVVTGKVSEWRGHMVSSDPAKLVDAWYSFRPSVLLDVDTMPFSDNGRRVTLSGFRERLTEANRREPELQAVWATGPKDWTDRLGNLGLDPELFRYQRAMNAGEGEAADAFTFKSDDAFVDFLLRAVVDDEDPNLLAEVFEGYLRKLAERGTLSVERDFVSGAIDLLTSLAGCAEQADVARQIESETLVAARRFRGSISSRHRLETDRLEITQGRLTELSGQEQQADRDVSRLNAIVLELKRLVAELRLRRAENQQALTKDELTRTRERVDAWQATEAVLHARTASAKAERLRRLVGEQEGVARPALEERDTTARAFARGLLHTASIADAAAASAKRAADSWREKESAERDQCASSQRSAAALLAQAAGFEARITEVRATVTEHIRSGWMASDDDPTVAAENARGLADEAKAAFDGAWAEAQRLAGETRARRDELEDFRRLAAGASETAERAARAADEAQATRDRLAGEVRLAELLGTDSIHLDSDTLELLERLATALQAHDREITDLSMVDAADRRVLEALGKGGLLPPIAEVSQTVEALASAGITAWSGWQYLAEMAPGTRDQVLEQHPELVGGVVLNDSGKLEQARDVLESARLLPKTIVAVGTTAAMSGELTPPARASFVVQPNPAMYDEEEAEAERVALTVRRRNTEDRLADLRRQKSADEELVRRLDSFRTRYPPGAVSLLIEEWNAAELALEQADLAVDTAGQRHGAAEEAESGHNSRIPTLRDDERAARERADVLDRLAETVAHLDGWADAVAECLRQADEAEAQADEAAQRADDCRARGDAQIQEADEQRRTADRCRAELGEVLGAGTVSDADPVPEQALDELRSAAQHAAQAYARVAVGADLRADMESSESDEARARAVVEGIAAEIRNLADELLASPDGADAAARAAAARRTGSAAARLEDELGRIRMQVGALRTKFEQFTPQDRSLEPFGRPNDIDHGEQLIAAAQREFEAARERFDVIKGSRIGAQEDVDNIRGALEGFGSVLDSLLEVEPTELPSNDASPFAGDLALARERRAAVRTDLIAAKNLLEAAEKDVRRAADELAQYAAEPRFSGMTSPVHRQITATKREDLPTYAAEWSIALRPRLRSLTDELEQIDRYRSNIVLRLTGLVDSALRTLRSAQRLSRLPKDLGDWAGQEFLRIKFDEPSESAVPERIAEMVDEVSTLSGDRGAPKRDGKSLLLRGVHAAVPKGFRVEMLKPDAVLRTERVRVSEIHDVFSGGQQLTAAIVLYCTLAALRANDRGRVRHRHSGVLFLDNPIGRASAGYLLELQFAVAAALGVQLVYTTGLFDAGALSAFPLIIRLRNDADLRAGLKHLSVDSMIKRDLSALGEPDGIGRIAATRVYRLPAEGMSNP
ncbi:hypothetical protein [Nocardia sp. NPDC020380]|uniref:hypothetical protein n=1 Tax=Nocardia sp. NPDC020380 TaxID=3364309 RepID=UPI0037B4B4B8